MKISIKDAGAIGLVSDAIPSDLPNNAWSRGRNIRFRDGCVERFLGEQSLFTDTSVVPYFVTSYQTTTKRYICHAGNTAVYVDDGTTRTDITGTAPTGTATDRWTGGTLNGVLILNNGVDNPMYWGGDTATNLATLTGWNTAWKARSIRPFKNYLMALNITKSGTNYPHMVKWSHAADPGTVPASWNEADPTKDAGELDLAETPDLIVDGLPLGDQFIIYKQRSMYSASFIGQPFIFRFQRLPGEFGILARGCVADTPAGHVVLTAGDVVVHQGQGAKSILTGRMRKWLFTEMDSQYFEASFVTTNPWRNEAWICFPSAGNSTCTRALVWNWNDNTFGVRDLDGVTYGTTGQLEYTGDLSWSDQQAWDADLTGWNQGEYSPAEARLVMCRDDSKIVGVDSSATFTDGNVTALLERTGISLDASDRVKLIRGVFPRIDAGAGTELTITVGASMTAETEPTWGSPTTYTVGSSYKVDAFTAGRFLALRIESTSMRPWRLRSFEVDVVPQGEF